MGDIKEIQMKLYIMFEGWMGDYLQVDGWILGVVNEKQKKQKQKDSRYENIKFLEVELNEK